MNSLKLTFTRARPPENCLLEAPRNSYQTEALDLLAMSDDLAAKNPGLAESFNEWRNTVERFLKEPASDDLATERRLEEISLDFRSLWIDCAQSLVAGELKSPPYNHLPLLPLSPSLHFNYERVISARQLQDKAQGSASKVSGWNLEVSAFGSGMAAITTVITVLRFKKDNFARADGLPLKMEMFGGYYETEYLFDLLTSSELECRVAADQEGFLSRFASGETDFLFLELIAYDWIQSLLDPVNLLGALAQRPADRPWVLILDVTLLGPTFDVGVLLAACKDRKPVAVLEIRSGLKLDQVGLEFSNVGVVKVWTPEGLDVEAYPVVARLNALLVNKRKLLGNGLSLSQLAILDAPWIFCKDLAVQHSQYVFDNNRRLALALVSVLKGVTGIFARINHPCLGAQQELSWAESPLVVLELREQSKEDVYLLEAVLDYEVRKRKLVVCHGGSFGFRHHRWEIIEPKYQYKRAGKELLTYLKVAMGSRTGPSLHGMILLLQELAAYPDMQALRAAYPDVKVRAKLAAFPDLQSLRKNR